jgi:pimeloyl-ACP methyl ester carboxylesterase
MSDFSVIYISGAGLRGYIWNDIVDELNMPSLVIDYKDAHSSLSGYIDEAMRRLSGLDNQRFIIVAHSAGGVIGGEVAKRLGDKLIGLIAISAIIPQPSQSFVSSLPIPQKFIMPILLKLAGTTPPETSIRNSLAKGLPQEQKDKIVNDFRAEGIGLYTDKTSGSSIPKVPILYVVTTNDAEFTKTFQLAQAKNLNAKSIEYIDSGHLPMISHHHELSQLISTFCKSIVLYK